MRLRGPGKHDEAAAEVMERYHADGVILVVIGGDVGHGCCIQTTSRELMERLPEMLEGLASVLREDRDAGRGPLQ